MSHTGTSHVTHMSKSCYTHEWVMSHTWMSHVTHMDDWYDTYDTCKHMQTHANTPISMGVTLFFSARQDHTHERVMSHKWTSHVTHMKESCYTYGWVIWHVQYTQTHVFRRASGLMWWLRWVGSIKLQVSFAEYHLFYRALLQKRPIILRSLLIVATPYLPCREGKTWSPSRWVSLLTYCVSYNSSMCVTWLIHMFDMTYSYVWFCSARQDHTYDESRYAYGWVMSHIWTSHETYIRRA